MKDKIKNKQIDQLKKLEQKLMELEELSDKLNDKLSNIEATYDSLLVKFGAKVRKVALDEVNDRLEEIEYHIIKKLVDDEMFELKMRERKEKE